MTLHRIDHKDVDSQIVQILRTLGRNSQKGRLIPMTPELIIAALTELLKYANSTLASLPEDRRVAAAVRVDDVFKSIWEFGHRLFHTSETATATVSTTIPPEAP